MFAFIMTLDADDLPRGVLGLQHAVNQLGREEVLHQLCYSSILEKKKRKYYTFWR